MAKSKTSKTTYPATIYVEVEHDDAEIFMSAYLNPEQVADLSEEKEVAIYKFVRMAKIRTKTEVI